MSFEPFLHTPKYQVLDNCILAEKKKNKNNLEEVRISLLFAYLFVCP